VVVNFNKTTKEVAQRIIDFLSGTVFALDGNMQRVSNDTFLFCSQQYEGILGYSREHTKGPMFSEAGPGWCT